MSAAAAPRVAPAAALADALGVVHPPAEGEVRIVSLVPSLTELLCALGLAPQLVGRTGFCIHPREVLRRIPKVGGTKDVDLDRVRALAPTHLVVNVDENEKPAVDALRPHVGRVVVTHPVEVDDNVGLYRLFGGLFDRQARARALEDDLLDALGALRRERFRPLRVLYLIWREPWMTVGPDTYIARMLAEIGLQAVSPPGGARYPAFDLQDFGPANYEAVLLSTEPYRFTEAHRQAFARDPRFGGRPVLLVDGEMTSWYGSRAIEGLRYLPGLRRALDEACPA